MSDQVERLQRLLGGAELASLRGRLRHWLEHEPRDERVLAVAPRERRALEGLLAQRPGRGRSIRLHLSALDAALARAAIAPDLATALGRLDGPLIDRISQRNQVRERWTAAFEQTALRPALRAWLADNRARGLVKRLAEQQPDRALALLRQTDAVLARLPAGGLPSSRLAAETLGDAHALDDGRPVATLVLAVLRTSEKMNAERAREIWAAAGVLVNELSKPVLVLNLPAATESITGELAADAARAGEPLHLSLRTLVAHRAQWRMAGRAVFVCENPTVVAQAASRLGSRSRPLVCTDGMPAASQRQLLRQLHDDGAELYYHGDFDWPGIRIGNLMMSRLGARPWRFREADYRAGPASNLALRGASVAACWDPALTQVMRERASAIHEEAVLGALLRDLDKRI